MIYDRLNEAYENSKKDIPDAINAELLHMLEVGSGGSCADKYNIFYPGKIVDYNDSSKEYAIRYLPVNFYKIWKPLMDLLIKDQIHPVCRVLELGCGPGTSTFGFVEFYKLLAIDNPNKSFLVEFVLIEKEESFISILMRLWLKYIKEMPSNLKIKLKPHNIKLNEFLVEASNFDKFDYIIESNLFNPNESIEEKTIDSLLNIIGEKLLYKHSSVIFIEPSSLRLAEMLKKTRGIMQFYNLSIYSPCFCAKDYCEQFPNAHIDISGVKLANFISEKLYSSKGKKTHSFEYVVFRNDDLKKYDKFENKQSLDNLGEYIGNSINFKAFITSINIRENEIYLKVCDGSFSQRKDVWVKVPKAIINEKDINYLNSGRGNFVNVKKAMVISETKIDCLLSTDLKILR